MAEDEPKPGFSTPGETGLGHGATAMVDTEEDVKNEPKMQELQLAAAKAERKTLKLKAAPDSGYGRRAGSDARDALLADLADQPPRLKLYPLPSSKHDS